MLFVTAMPSSTRRRRDAQSRGRSNPALNFAPWFPFLALAMAMAPGNHVKKIKKKKTRRPSTTTPITEQRQHGSPSEVHEVSAPTHTLAGVPLAGIDSSITGDVSHSSTSVESPPEISPAEEHEEDPALQAEFFAACHRKLVDFIAVAQLPRFWLKNIARAAVGFNVLSQQFDVVAEMPFLKVEIIYRFFFAGVGYSVFLVTRLSMSDALQPLCVDCQDPRLADRPVGTFGPGLFER